MSKIVILYKAVTAILLAIFFLSFGHLLHMGTMSALEECPHAVKNHETCKVILENQLSGIVALKESFLVVLTLFGVVFIASIFIQKTLKVSLLKQNQDPFYMELLFSNGILNPKAP